MQNQLTSCELIWNQCYILCSNSIDFNWNHLKICEIISNELNTVEFTWDHFNSFEDKRNLLKLCERNRNHVKSFEITWNWLNIFVTTWKQTQLMLCEKYIEYRHAITICTWTWGDASSGQHICRHGNKFAELTWQVLRC